MAKLIIVLLFIYYTGVCFVSARKDGSHKLDEEESHKHQSDACNQPKVSGWCRGHFPRFHYDKESKSCKKFVYGGCGGNDNNFRTQEQCEELCDRCSQRKMSGPCRGYFIRYHYHKPTESCKKFVYGGCDGNDNNFETVDKCNNACGGGDTSEPAKCSDKRSSKCSKVKAMMTEDSWKSLCNIVPWFTKQCKRSCGICTVKDDGIKKDPQRKSIATIKPPIDQSVGCNQLKSSGPCEGYFLRYYFDITSKSCHTFVYGGCQGNLNNFETLQQCLQTCGSFAK